MKKNPTNLPTASTLLSDDGQALRRQAEARLQNNEAQEPTALSPEEMRQMLHELQVHQIELELQNEELRRTQAELQEARERYFELYDLAPVGYLVISENGLIVEANLTAAGLLGVARGALIEQPLSHFILSQDQDIYYLHRKQLFETGIQQVYTLKLHGKEMAFWAEIDAAAAQSAAGAPICRMVIKDVSERKQAEEDLAIQREIYEKLLALWELPLSPTYPASKKKISPDSVGDADL